jgi:DNA-binding FrmR family transcriptional regulator
VTVDEQPAYTLRNRLKTVAGHVRGVQRMVETDTYCIDLIAQVQAVQRALDKVNALVLEQHLNRNVMTQLHSGTQPEREQVVNELLTVFQHPTAGTPAVPVPHIAAGASTRERLEWLARIEVETHTVQQLIDNAAYPVEIITHVQRVQQMLAVFQNRVLADHLNGCVTTAIQSEDDSEHERVVRELLRVFTAVR